MDLAWRQGRSLAMGAENYSALDKEVLVLSAVWGLVDLMVNYALFENEPKTTEVQLRFRTEESSNIFLVILADFLSLPKRDAVGLATPNVKGSLGETYLGLLRAVADAPILGQDSESLAKPLRASANWLDECTRIDSVWLPSIDRNDAVSVRRMTYLKICGTATKHNLTRLDRVAEEIQRILLDNQIKIDKNQAYLVIPDFQEFFQRGLFLYHSTTIACFLNNIRWGIYDYLASEFNRAYQKTEVMSGLQRYVYDVPSEVTKPLTQWMYWELMNKVCARPYFPRFTVHSSWTRGC